MICSLTFKIIVTPKQFPNIVDHWYLWLLMPTHFAPYPIRAFNFILTYYIAKNRPTDESDQVDEETKEKFSCVSLLHWLARHPKFLRHKAFFIYSCIIQGIAFIIGVIRQITVKSNLPRAENVGEGVQQLSYIMFLLIVTVVSIFLWICVHKLKSINDNLKINAELITIGILWIILFLPFIGTGWLSLKGYIPWDRLSPIFCVVLCVISFLVSFGMPVHMAIVQPKDIKLGTKILDSLESILADERASELLISYLERQCCVDNYYFLKRVKEYQQITNPDELNERYEKIIKEFINSDSVSHINISDQMTKKLLKERSDGVKPSSHSFNEPYQEINKVTAQNIAFGFKDDPAVRKYARQLNAQSLETGD